MEDDLATALQLADKYKEHLVKEQGHLYSCHLSFFKVLFFIQVEEYSLVFQEKKTLKDVGNFFPYLLQRVSRFSEGIHQLKVVGQKIRQGNKSLETGKTASDPQTKSSDNSLELGPLHREPASIAPRVSGTRQLVPEPSKWVGGEDGAGDMSGKTVICNLIGFE